jgi:hypothetical protein
VKAELRHGLVGEASVRGDPVQPCTYRRSALESAEVLPGSHEHFLSDVFGVVERAEHPVAMQLKFGAVGGDQASERNLVTALGPSQEQGVIVNWVAGTVLAIPARLIWG